MLDASLSQLSPDLAKTANSGLHNERRLTRDGELDGAPLFLLDVPETIPAMGYGTHQFFRYYGKFPSILGRMILSRAVREEQQVLDCYCGSGTTLVEAQIAGCPSFGVDINPLAVLASRVKTSYVDTAVLHDSSKTLMRERPRASAWRPSSPPPWLRKWFTEQASAELAELHQGLERMPPGIDRQFLVLAFLAIVRRVSRAFDGEVRPHVNAKKRERNVAEAFEMKVADMLAGYRDLDHRRPDACTATAVSGDNRDPATYHELLGERTVDLVVAHPPYLNSFNYLPVYNLEFAWAEGLDDAWQGKRLESLLPLEQKAWPATSRRFLDDYYDNLIQTLETSAQFLNHGGLTALVIGDATMDGILEPVHANAWQALKQRGWGLREAWYRTTHYGMGKYAYQHRADYHGAGIKRDAILFLTPP